MNPICFYHKSDLDGVCSAAIVKHFVPDCELYGIDYGDEFPWGKAREGETDWVIVGGEEQHPPVKEKRTVYVVDFSLPTEDMKRLAAVSNLIWIDHHKTAVDAYNASGGLGSPHEAVLVVGLAACELCWHHLNGSTIPWVPSTLPEAVRLLGAYDPWRKDDPEWESKILPFQYGMRGWLWAYDPEAKQWEHVLSGLRDDPDLVCMWSFERTLNDGGAILRFQSQQNRKIAEVGAFETQWTMPDPDKQPIVGKNADGREYIFYPGPQFKVTPNGGCERVPDNVMPSYRCICLNTPLNSSQSFDGVYDPEKHDIMVAFTMVSSGRWRVSLYSDKSTINCGDIAKVFGGGGHKGAAGFLCNTLPWEKFND